jgi:DNA polymerase
MQKSQYLNVMHDMWSQCQGCALSCERRNVVFGYGNPDAQVMIIGEAPGENEDASGLPFVGKAGLLLDQYLGQVSSRIEVIETITELNAIKGTSQAAEHRRNEKRITLRELLTQEFYFTNVVMCRPPENRDPLPEEINACRTRLLEQIYTVDPVLIIAAGRIAAEALLQKKVAITAARGQLFDIEFQGRAEVIRYTAMAVLHPSYLARVNDFKQPGGECIKTYRDFLQAMHMLDEYNVRHYGIPKPSLRPRME